MRKPLTEIIAPFIFKSSLCHLNRISAGVFFLSFVRGTGTSTIADFYNIPRSIVYGKRGDRKTRELNRSVRKPASSRRYKPLLRPTLSSP